MKYMKNHFSVQIMRFLLETMAQVVVERHFALFLKCFEDFSYR